MRLGGGLVGLVLACISAAAWAGKPEPLPVMWLITVVSPSAKTNITPVDEGRVVPVPSAPNWSCYQHPPSPSGSFMGMSISCTDGRARVVIVVSCSTASVDIQHSYVALETVGANDNARIVLACSSTVPAEPMKRTGDRSL